MISPENNKVFKKYGKIYPKSLVEEFENLKNFEADKLSLIATNDHNRRNHLTIFYSLLEYLEKELMVINQSQSDMFKHQLRTESESLLSAYEVFLKTLDIEDFVDTLFIIYQ